MDYNNLLKDQTALITAGADGIGYGIAKRFEEAGAKVFVCDINEDAVNQEKEWAEFLFKDGSMIGLSVPLLSNYIEYIANKRLRMIGLNPVYDISSANNPLPWTRHWFNSRGLQNAPQETEIESYVIGGIKQDVQKDQFKKFKL